VRGYALYRDHDGIVHRREDIHPSRRGLLAKLEACVPGDCSLMGVVLTDVSHAFGVIEGGRDNVPTPRETETGRRMRLRAAAGR
jgi:hypothetical protein